MATRGRPAFKATPDLRRKVAIAAGGGMSHEQIALALGIARNTLEKYFVEELTTGAFARRLEVLVALHAAAKKGNVSAAKAYASSNPEFSAPTYQPENPAQPMPQPPAQPQPTAQPMGKKERLNVEATVAQVGTDWEHLLPNNPNGLVQ